MPSPLPPHPDLEWLRKQARRLLRAAHEGDADALARFRAIPQFASLGDAALRARVQLTDAQHAIAREHGAESWPALKRAVEDRLPLAAQAARFLAAIREHHPVSARQRIARTPAIAHSSVFAASAAGDADFVASAIARDPASATAADGEGWSALLYASASPLHATGATAAAGILRVAHLLLDAGADPNTFVLFQRDDPHSRIPALYFACMARNVPLVSLLLERGANPNDGESVYHSAEQDIVPCLELLLAHGADLSGRHSNWNNTPLYFISGYRPLDPHTPRMLRGMRWMLEHGADPNVTSYAHRETPLHTLARGGHSAETLEVLIAHGADVNARRADGKTPYVLALRAGATVSAATLLAHGATTEGATPADELLSACMAADESAARAVLAAHPHLIEQLTAEDRQAFGDAAAADRVESLRLMAGLGFPVDREAAQAGTALHWAAWNGRPASAQLLLELGSPLDLRDREFGSSPIAWAAHGSGNCRSADDDYIAVIDLLLARGPDRAASINRWGQPPESMASPRVAAYLKERGFAV